MDTIEDTQDLTGIYLSAPIRGRIICGSPLPIIILHGWGQNAARMEPWASLIASKLGREVRIMDLPGFGSSTPGPPPEGWNTIEYTRWLVNYLDICQIQRADFVGHSFGGRLLVRLASEYPNRVNRIVLMSAAGLPAKKTISKKITSMVYKTLRAIIYALDRTPEKTRLTTLRDRYSSEDRRNAGSLRPTFDKVVVENLASEASKIKCPTLIINGANDIVTPPYMAEHYHELIKNSEYALLSDVDHFPYLDVNGKPLLCAHLVCKFLKSGSERTS